MQTIAIANHKGGVAKTATVHNLGAALALEHGQHVLLIDTDPQASLTGACGVEDEIAPTQTVGRTRFVKQVFSLAEVLGGRKPGQVSLTDVLVDLGDNLWLCPADTALASSEEGLASRLGREYALKKVLATVAHDFDVCLIDCPPDQGWLTINAMTAAQAIMVPSQPTAQDLRGLLLFVETIKAVQTETNPNLVFLGILLTFYDARLKHHRAAVEAMKEARLPILPVTIGRSIRVAEAAGTHQPVITFAPRNPQTHNYLALAKLVDEQLALSR